MKTTNCNLETLRQMMGPEATTPEAVAMLELLTNDGVTDTDQVSDGHWTIYTQRACEVAAKS